MAEQHDPADAVGTVTHYFGHLSVAAVSLTAPLRIGDEVHIQGHTTNLSQRIESMEVDHQPVTEAKPGDDVAIKVVDHVREHDSIFREG
jgi:putative protease